MIDSQAVQALAALAQESRLRVFRFLVEVGREGAIPSRMTELLGITPTLLSFHLRELMHAGLVTQERDGRNLIYRAHLVAMNDLLGFLTANCCQGEPCLDTTSIQCTTC